MVLARHPGYIGVNLECVGPLRISIPYEDYNWDAVGVLAHEIGHLLGGHTVNSTNGHREESEADEWAGWAMYRLGASMPLAYSHFASGSREGSKTHPPRATRIASVIRGWSRARESETAPIRVPVAVRTPIPVSIPVLITAPAPVTKQEPATKPPPKEKEATGWAARLRAPLPWVSGM